MPIRYRHRQHQRQPVRWNNGWAVIPRIESHHPTQAPALKVIRRKVITKLKKSSKQKCLKNPWKLVISWFMNPAAIFNTIASPINARIDIEMMSPLIISKALIFKRKMYNIFLWKIYFIFYKWWLRILFLSKSPPN